VLVSGLFNSLTTVGGEEYWHNVVGVESEDNLNTQQGLCESVRGDRKLSFSGTLQFVEDLAWLVVKWLISVRQSCSKACMLNY
jgi:hypothetical protein